MYNEYPERIYVDRGIDASTAALLNSNNANELWPMMAMMNGGMGGFGGGAWWWILYCCLVTMVGVMVLVVTVWLEQVSKIVCQQFKKHFKIITIPIC